MSRIVRLAAFVCFSVACARADLDFDADGLGDVWEAKFLPAALAPGDDDDGDGRTNLEESEAGTDPLRQEDLFAVRQIAVQGDDLLLKWSSQAGKRYQLQTTVTPGLAVSWQSIPGLHAGIEGDLEISTPRPASGTAFFRVVAADVDTDSDGLTDWEEIQAGMDPNEDHVHPCHCEICECGPDCGCGDNDLERLTHGLQTPPVVSVEATDAESTEPPNGTTPAEPGSFTVKRHGGIGRVIVSLQSSGTASASDLAELPPTIAIPLAATEVPVPVVPMPDALTESTEVVFLAATAGSAYTLGAAAPAGVLIRDHVQANGTGLTANFWQHSGTANNNPKLTGTPNISRVDATVNFDSAIAAWPGAGITSNYFTSRWEGEVLPEYSQVYTFFSSCDDAGRLWVNGQLIINNWPPSTGAAVSNSEKSAVIALEAGKRYPVIFDHYENSGAERAIFSWQSQSQTKQVVPMTRLFPNTPPRILGPFEAWAFVGAPAFTYQIQASGSPTSFAAANLPDGFTLNQTTGLITGTPAVPGNWTITLTATNSRGSDSAFLQLTVIETSGGITRELWTGAGGSTVAEVPVGLPPSSTSVLTSLDTLPDSGDDYGARIRGFVTAPASGDYRFFLRADEAAVFYLSDDDEPVNSWKRAELTSPAGSADWTGAAQSPLLRLEAGSRYYLEILHKESSGSDHLALGWSKPGQPDTAPSEIVPGYALTRFEDVALGSSPDGTLFFTPLTPQSGVVTNAYGSCTLRLSTDRRTAWVTPEFGNLGSAFFGMHVHDNRLPSTSNIVFDLDEPGVEILADGSYVWHIVDTGTLTAEQIADGIGVNAFLNVHTVDFQSGEIKGYFSALDGSTAFTPPPPPPDWTAEPAAAHTDANAAARFLQQATFGANPDDITDLTEAASYDAWIDDEFAKPATTHLPHVEQFRNVSNPSNSTYPGDLTFNSWWRNSIQGDDQLRQRVAFALSEIMVVSENGPLDERANAVSDYYDTLLQHAFGNARDLLEAVTLHPAMGRYLDMLRNDKPNLTAGSIPNENYAREILQLFSLGLYRFHPDGSLILNSKGLPVPVYDQEAVIGYAHVFTGWGYNYTGAYVTSFPSSSNWTEPMREVPARHFTGKKRLLNNVVLPGMPMLGGLPLDPYASHSGATISGDPQFQALARQELDAVHDQIFHHPNFGPFLCRQLIQRLVTSTPSRGYIHRVVSKFNDNGSGVRGDLQAVVKAILLDYEARSLAAAGAPGYGKQREPVLRVTQLARAFRPANNFTGSYVQDGGVITVDTSPTLHRMVTGQSVLLGFSGAPPASTDGTYSLSGTFAPTTTAFSVRTKDIDRGTWAQTGTTLTVSLSQDYSFSPGQSVYLRFRSGGGGLLADGVHVILTEPTATSFTVLAPDSATRSGACDTAWLRGGYSQDVTGGVTTLTVTCGTVPGIGAGAKMKVVFTQSTGDTTAPADGTYTIESVSDTEPRRFVLVPDVGLPSAVDDLEGTFHAAPLAPVMNRGGTAVSGYSDWSVNGTDTDLGQTPLRAPTVFNFFEPDYKFPGLLSANGLVTPEFQISSDTNVIRQANFLFGGIYSSSTTNPNLGAGYTNGFSSFKSNAHDIMMDFSPWMGLRNTTAGNYWTNTANLRDLIRELSKLLMAGQMSTGMENEIYNFVSNTANIAYTATTDGDRRNRVRAIIYFIAVSPEHAIQR